MCAIFGLLNIDDDNFNLSDLLNSMSHRGPDKSDYYINKTNNNCLILGHNRLKIVDINGGDQPMKSYDDSLVIVFNGEIYNHDALRKNLINLGHKFKSNNSDTEVLLNGYKEWGSEVTNYLNGMWSFCIYDINKNKLFLSRDRFGEKPLFYTINNNSFIFSSELILFNKIKNIKIEIDYKNIQKYCAYGFFPSETTPYKKIFKLKSGHSLEIDLNLKRNKITKYWEYISEPNYKKSLEDWSNEINFLLKKSVKQRMVADVEVGVFLSGGLDSSIISLLASKEKENLNTFSIGFDQKEFDETNFSNVVAKAIKSNHHNTKINLHDITNIQKELFSKINEPLSDSSLISYYKLCKSASSNLKVVLGGDSADELLAGYDTLKVIKYLNIIKILRLDKINPLAKFFLKNIKVKFGNMNLQFKLDRYLRFSEKNIGYANPQWLSPLTNGEINEIFNTSISNEDIYEDSLNLWNNSNNDNIDKSIEFYSRIFLQDQILVKTDRLSMMHGLEVRSPFLDYDLIDCFRKIPHKYKLNRNISKYILKKTYENSFEKDFVYRGKMGFTTPISKWLLEENKVEINSKFLSLRSNLIEKKYIEHKNHINDNRIFLWNILNLDNFLLKNNL